MTYLRQLMLSFLQAVRCADNECCLCGRTDNLLKNAPHTAESVLAEDWNRPYSREDAAFPAEWVRQAKFWPSVRRVDNVYGDRNLQATLTEEVPPMAASVGGN